MSLSIDRAPVGAPGGTPGVPRRLRPVLEAFAGGSHSAPRVLLVGNAGSGKTTLLRHVQDALIDGDRVVEALPATPAAVVRLPVAHVLIVDDLQLLPPELLAAVRRRADDPDAGLIVASRPWPTTQASVTIARRLEQAQPAIVLGHVTRADVLDDLDAGGRAIAPGCLERILELTEGVTWLVADALAAHDDRDCADDPGHRALARILSDRIAHRLDTVDDEIRGFIERRCLLRSTSISSPSAAEAVAEDDLALRAYAEGLLLRGGRPAPVVRSAVRAVASMQSLARLASETGEDFSLAISDDDPDYSDLLARWRMPGLSAALVEQGDRMLEADPRRARELYRASWDAGLETTAVLRRRARASWATGDVDDAAVLAEAAAVLVADEQPASSPRDTDDLTALVAAVWAARGMIAQGHAVFRASPPRSVAARTPATIAALGSGDGDAVSAAPDRPQDPDPSTLGTAMLLLDRGLRSTLTDERDPSVLVDLVRASEMYTSARTSAPIPEPPAVIAAIAALHLGDTATARSVIDDAIAGGHAGSWARPRLLLWRAWIAVQRVRPHQARRALADAEAEPGIRSPRDRLLARAVEVALARRYGDAADLAAAWHSASTALLRVDVDTFLFLPLTELICAATKSGDADRAGDALDGALEIARGLGEPALWTAAVRWAGVQRSILRGRPEELIPHAHALVAAGRHNAVAAAMAKAGRVWTSVLAGSVDPDAVEEAAQQLAAYGMAWDAARLAGHGAARSADRRVSARLLAQAREIHPIELEQRTDQPTAGTASGESDTSPGEVLSEREREVARLVLQGKTYAEIGEAIFISPRTAEHHIAHIRRRLGATSRSDVLAKLRLLMADSVPADDGAHTDPGGDPHRSA